VQPTNPAHLSGFVQEAARQGVDFLILDTPPKSDREAIAAAEQADLVLMVSTPSVMDLRAMHNTIRLVQLTKLKPGAKVRLMLNRMRPMGSAAVEAAQALRELNVDVLPLGFGYRVAFEYCLIEGEGASEYEPDGQAATEAANLYKYICKLVYKNTKSKPKPKGSKNEQNQKEARA
jgi:chromosome partitioning protein